MTSEKSNRQQPTDESDGKSDEDSTETARTGHGAVGAHAEPDVESDPALNDRLGSDWGDEGGAASSGPATSTTSDDS